MPSAPTVQCIKRLQMELRKQAVEPNPSFLIGADPHNMLHCYFIFDGPEDTPYAGGRYIGMLIVPPDYPFKPPAIRLRTPSGRFKVGIDICLSNSSFHPEQWSPLWGLRTIVMGLISFLVSEEVSSGTMEASAEQRRILATQSVAYNVRSLKHIYSRVLPALYERDVALVNEAANGPTVTEDENVPPTAATTTTSAAVIPTTEGEDAPQAPPAVAPSLTASPTLAAAIESSSGHSSNNNNSAIIDSLQGATPAPLSSSSSTTTLTRAEGKEHSPLLLSRCASAIAVLALCIGIAIFFF